MTREEVVRSVQNTNWEFAEADTQFLTHNIHRYSGKFIPQIAGNAIELLTDKGEVVLDSYMGSGTTLLESSLRGRNSIGIDLNPLAVLISNVKNTPVQDNDLTELYSALIPYVQMMASGGQLSFLNSSFDETKCRKKYTENHWRLDDVWNKKWYQEDVLHQLVEIYAAIDGIDNVKAKNIALVAFSDILRKSSNASSRYPNVMYDKNAKKKALPAKSFLESLFHVIDSVKAMSEVLNGANTSTVIWQGNNLSLPLDNNSVDAIVSHPPYIAAIPYAEYGSLSLTWLGYDCKELDSELTGGKRHSTQVVSRFEKDYETYFVESYRVLKPQRYMFLMVGNPVAHGEKINLCDMTIRYAEEAGFDHIVTAVRHGMNRRGNKMGDEYLIFFQK